MAKLGPISNLDLPNGLGNIERTILTGDERGISKLAAYLPPDFCTQTAKLLTKHMSRVLLISGFYVNGSPETDGPPGTAALAHALLHLGSEVMVVTDQISFEVTRAITPPTISCIEFPMLEDTASSDWASNLLENCQPTIVGFIERPGPTKRGVYLNMLCNDITKHCGLTHHLLSKDIPSFGVGDGGNEVGMGSYHRALIQEAVVEDPCYAATDELVIASISNWGALGIVAELVKLSGQDLLPHPEMEEARLRAMVRRGAVDGFSGINELKVDGRDLGSYMQVLIELRKLVGQKGEIS